MRTPAVLLLALTLAVPALAFRPRPVSDLRFEDRLENSWVKGYQDSSLAGPGVVGVVSDGTDSLFLWTQTNGAIYAQIVTRGDPYGPAVLIGTGSRYGLSAVWTGSEYLVAWTNKSGLFLRAVSKSGALVSEPRLAIAFNGFSSVVRLVSNGRRILVSVQMNPLAQPDGGLVGFLLDLNGQPIGQVFPLLPGLQLVYLIGTGDGFSAAVLSNGLRVLRLDDTARPLPPDGGTLIDGSSGLALVSLASDGTNVAVIFGSGSSAATVKTAIIGPHGEVAQGPRTILPGSQYGAYVGNLLWNGSEFVIALTSSTDPTVAHSDSRLLRISRTGELLDDSMILPSRSRDIISNGTEYLITILPGSFVRIPFGSTTQIVSADPVRSIDTQQAIAIAGGRRDYLASWLETDRGGLTIRAARIDAQGRYLDGAGIVIASLPAADRPQQSVSVDSDGENWLVVWSDQSGGIHGVRVSSDGVLLDPQPIAIPGGYGASVRWGRDSWMVVSTDGSRLISTMVARNGLVGAPVFFDQVQAPDRGAPYSPTPFVYGNPSLAFDGQQFVVAAAIDEGYCTAETCVGATAVVTERIDLAGNSVAGSMFIAPPAEYRERSMPVATNGSQDLVVFQQDYKIVGLLSNKGSAPMTMPIAEDGANATVMWDGSEFVVALTSHKEGVSQLVRVSTLGVVDSTLTLPHDPDEFSFGLAFPPSVPAELKTSPATGLPLAFLTQHDAYDAVPRAAFLLAGDAQESMVTQQVPPAPSINGAIGDRDGATLSWAPQDHVLGFSIELRQPDGSERVIGVAAGSATSAHVSYAGLQGTAVRLRAWNAAGLSSPSSEVQPTTRRRAAR